ncbi:hypothetical protein [Micromonospora sp. HUAS LYJ1]|uniref:hypothetical protein n=1 Tax=Micromonospora sp. HUAS LYJ1 TaxID=3061626 RepID=UPI0026728227|nr:hypothetical protein [Micromonospora sp. HUAS LYJ1]WKU06920.1 hypothetical protein Q2K16_07675 [Micromonospora sp. HUAS LYJ1]
MRSPAPAGATPPAGGPTAAGEYLHLVEFATRHVGLPGYDFGGQFAFGLDLILDALANAG